jgi:peptide deformylase
MKYQLISPNEPILQQELPEITFEELKEKHDLTPQELYDNLIETMRSTGGIGLSANQCGLPVRAFVMFTDLQKGEATIFFNPKVTWVSEDTEMFTEGCLTYPFLFLNLRRPKSIKFTYTDINGEHREAGFTGLTARIFQHEFDHMQGKNFTMWASKLKLEMAWKKAKKKMKNIKKVA